MEPSDCDARRLENLWRFLIRLTQGARRHSHVVMHGNRDHQLGVWNIRATAGRPVLTLALAGTSLWSRRSPRWRPRSVRPWRASMLVKWPASHFQVTTEAAVRQKDREQNDAEFVETCT